MALCVGHSARTVRPHTRGSECHLRRLGPVLARTGYSATAGCADKAPHGGNSRRSTPRTGLTTQTARQTHSKRRPGSSWTLLVHGMRRSWPVSRAWCGQARRPHAGERDSGRSPRSGRGFLAGVGTLIGGMICMAAVVAGIVISSRAVIGGRSWGLSPHPRFAVLDVGPAESDGVDREVSEMLANSVNPEFDKSDIRVARRVLALNLGWLVPAVDGSLCLVRLVYPLITTVDGWNSRAGKMVWKRRAAGYL